MNFTDYIRNMIKVSGCEFTPGGNPEDDELSYVSFFLEFPEGVQLFTENDNRLTVTINV